MLAERLLGNRSRLPLAAILSLRVHLLRSRGTSILAVLALTASVGLAVTVELATRSLSTALAETADAVLGRSQIGVTAGDVGMDDEWIDRLREVPGVRSAAGMVHRTLRVPGRDGADGVVSVIGVDLLYESEVRSYAIERDGFVVRDPLRLVAVPGAMMISTSLAERLGIGEDDVIELRSEDGMHRFTVRGLLTGALAEAYGGQVALMDLFGMQQILGLGHRVDRIDVAVAPGADVPEVERRIAELIGPAATVGPSVLRYANADALMGALQRAIWGVVVIGTFLALFLSYAITSLAVDRRLEEFALLRAAGMQGRSVIRLILGDALLLAVAGTLLGFAFAVASADALVAVFSNASSYLEHVRIPPAQVQGSTLLVAFGVGVPVALLAAVEPALRAGRLPPLDVLQSYRLPPSPQRASRTLAILGVLVAGLGAGAWAAGDLLPGGLRLALVVPCGAVAVGTLVPQLLLRAQAVLQALFGRILPRLGHLVCAFVLDRPIETGVTLAVWAAVTAGLVALASMVHSLVVDIDDYWVGLHGPETVMVFAQDPLASRDREPIRRETVETVRATPGVLDTAEYNKLSVLVRGEPVVLESLSTQVLRARAPRPDMLWDPPEPSFDALLRGELLMNEAFARHFGVEVGDEVVLATDRGPHAFRVGGFGRSFVANTGELFLDIEAFRAWFSTRGPVQLAIWTAEPRAAVLDEVQRRAGGQALFFRHGEAFHRHTARVMARFNDLLMIPVLLIATVGVLALVNLLFGKVASRRRELAILRAAGATTGDRVGLVVLHGLTIGALGTTCGLLLGVPWSRILTETIADALGYRIAFSTNLPVLALVTAGGLVLSVAAGVGPALVGRRRVAGGVSQID